MKKFTLFAVAYLALCAQSALAQVSVSGTVYDNSSNESLAGVNIVVKGKVIGTVTDVNGNFSLTVKEAPPITLVFSFVGFETQEIRITSKENTSLTVNLQERSLLGKEVVVSASRVEETILESPVSIEKMGIMDVRNTASDNYYKAIANLKGVDIATSSINFQIINARGFASTGNTRFVQLIDGMDTQAPALNFPIGNLNGPSELDVESVELIPGASSALYGPNAFNGILLINSKNPFEYQGLSAMTKLGVNHIDADYGQSPSPMYEASIRYAKAFNDKLAFKVNFSYMRADDWQGTSAMDRNALITTPEGFSFNPGADRLHYMGDEASTNIGFLGFAANAAFSAAGTPNDNPRFQSLRALFNQELGTIKTQREFSDLRMLFGDIPSQTVSRTPYAERHLIDYGAENTKVNTGLYYRINDRHELSYLYNAGFGTSIYTGAQRYSLSNFGIQQHRLQLRSDNFFIRAYSTMEDSGDSYITEFAGNVMNESWKSNTEWFVRYTANYLEYLFNLQDDQGNYRLEPGELSTLSDTERIRIQEGAFQFARDQADIGRITPGTAEFDKRLGLALESGTIPNGPKFADKSRLYHAEGQYDFKNEIDFIELQAGASYRIFDLRSNGTIFQDGDGGLQISEYGAYAQAGKKLGDFKLSGSLRYDKNENFRGQVNPRISGVFNFADNHYLRASYQTGFRNPTTQGQYINLNIISARLLGGLPEVTDQYKLTENSYKYEAVRAYSDAVFSNLNDPNALFINRDILNNGRLTELNPVVPEKVNSMEIGYKSLINNTLMIDAAYYYNIYNDFITQIQVRKSSGDINDADNKAAGSALASLLSGNANNTFQVYTNIDKKVSSQGAVLGLTYGLPRNFTLSSNYSWNILNEDLGEGRLSEFNTPEHKINFSFGNRKVTDNIGFNITWRWQDDFIWESSFAQGPVPSYSTVDAQISYKFKELNSLLKIGGSNLLNNYYIQSLGGPEIGAIYYISLTFDELMN